jgi:rod shape-determining protein MreD
MIRRFFPAAFVSILLILHILFHSLVGLGNSLPDLVPIALVVVVIRGGMGWAASIGFLIGVLEDSFSTSFLGLNALAWMIAGTVGGSIRGTLYGNRVALSVILVALLKMIHEVVFTVVYLWGYPGEILSRLLFRAPFSVIFSAGLALLLFLLLDRHLLSPKV